MILMMEAKHKLEEPETKGEDVGADGAEVSWEEFTRNTTFHGLKYVFHNSSKIRR